MKGACLCGAVGFEVAPEVAAGITAAAACHCGQCRKQSGHVWASFNAPREALTITGSPRWYQSSAHARRGFCPGCGAFLFWEEAGNPEISVSAGALEAPTGLTLTRHIFTADKGDYYEIDDGVPQS
ncbi:GFA family protein [Pseudoroseicyclus sp. CXY001]|uniref:GFA family protein n=1 Tax=Pseudoroseicyclus sp. CXY001 TaxID=3242492 RepID=UPI0035712DE8